MEWIELIAGVMFGIGLLAFFCIIIFCEQIANWIDRH